MANTEYDIYVDDRDNVTVTPDKAVLHWKKEEKAKFKSNKEDTVIRYVTTPFNELAAGEILVIEKGKGPYKGVYEGKHHFECGFIKSDGNFALYGGGGGDTDVEP